MLIAKFPFLKIGSGPLGEIYRPYAEVSLFSDKRDKWFKANMVVDSGADYTLLPKIYAFVFEVDLASECTAETSIGVGGSETVYLHKRGVLLKIGNWEKRIPVGFLERDDIPPLLGRLECMEALRVVFDNFETRFEK